MPQATTEVALQFLESCAAETALQQSLFCNADVIFTKGCAATRKKLHATLKKLRCRKVALSCRFPADFRLPLPRLGPADLGASRMVRCRALLLAREGSVASKSALVHWRATRECCCYTAPCRARMGRYGSREITHIMSKLCGG